MKKENCPIHGKTVRKGCEECRAPVRIETYYVDGRKKYKYTLLNK